MRPTARPQPPLAQQVRGLVSVPLETCPQKHVAWFVYLQTWLPLTPCDGVSLYTFWQTHWHHGIHHAPSLPRGRGSSASSWGRLGIGAVVHTGPESTVVPSSAPPHPDLLGGWWLRPRGGPSGRATPGPQRLGQASPVAAALMCCPRTSDRGLPTRDQAACVCSAGNGFRRR